MGGMHGFCPVLREQNEPVFHAFWDCRIFGIAQASGPYGIHDPHEMHSALETAPSTCIPKATPGCRVNSRGIRITPSVSLLIAGIWSPSSRRRTLHTEGQHHPEALRYRDCG